jgi:hypothetical protein
MWAPMKPSSSSPACSTPTPFTFRADPCTLGRLLRRLRRHRAGRSPGCASSSPSILLESRAWLAQPIASYAFVDPEIGPMGAVAGQAGIRFGYLHVISNNLATHYPRRPLQ